MQELLFALDDLKNTNFIFTMPNADTDSKIIRDLIKDYVKNRSNSFYFNSLGQLNYFSCVSQVDGVIGNSSSGLLEVPSFNIPTINIGDRQKGRIRAKSVIDCSPTKEKIKSAISKIYDKDFLELVKSSTNPYSGNGFPVDNALKIIEETSFKNLLKKEFYDVPFSTN